MRTDKLYGFMSEDPDSAAEPTTGQGLNKIVENTVELGYV